MLGWTVNGPLRGYRNGATTCGQPDVTVNRISVTSLDDLWKQQLKADFPESSRDEQMGLSREDRHFMDLVTKSAKLMNGHYSIGLPLRKRDASIPNNRRVSQQRALSLKRKYDKVA